MRNLLLFAMFVATVSHSVAQDFKRTKLTVGQYTVDAMLAVTENQRLGGLQGARSLSQDEGMLFVFADKKSQCLWTRNTDLSLTVAFIQDDGAIVNLADMQPNSTTPHCAKQHVRYALVVNQGWFTTKYLREGSIFSGEPFMQGSTVVLKPDRSGKPSSTGSGFAISDSVLITNAHVAKGCVRMRVNGSIDAKLDQIDAQNDLATLTLGSPLSSFGRLRKEQLALGESVVVLGHPLHGLLSTGLHMSTGNVTALSGLRNDSRFFQLSAPIQPGNSGGPVLDTTGAIVGVVVSKLNVIAASKMTGDIAQNVNFAINLNTLTSFLQASRVNYTGVSRGDNDLSPAKIVESSKGIVALVECWHGGDGAK